MGNISDRCTAMRWYEMRWINDGLNKFYVNTSLKFTELVWKESSEPFRYLCPLKMFRWFSAWNGSIPHDVPNFQKTPWCACFHSGYEHGSVLVQIEPSEDIRGKRSCMQHDQSSESSCCNRTESLQFKGSQTGFGKVLYIGTPPKKKIITRNFFWRVDQ